MSTAASDSSSASKISKLILSTGNIMASSSSLLSHSGGRRPAFSKSNAELTSSLRTAFEGAKASIEPAPSGNSNSTSWTSSSPMGSSSSSSTGQLASLSRILYIPSPSYSLSPLSEEKLSYDITLKLFFLPTAHSDAVSRTAHAREALSQVLEALQMPSVDLLIVSFPGIFFDADDGDSSSDSDIEDQDEHVDTLDSLDRKVGVMPVLTRTLTSENRLVNSISSTWAGLESLHASGLVSSLGVSEFGSERLQRFLPLTRVRPAVDQINVRDCCVVPKELILYAKEQGIQLLVHNDCTDILPTGTVREILKEGFAEGNGNEWLKGDIVPQWVVKYTAVVRDRGVIENKGYFAMAEVR